MWGKLWLVHRIAGVWLVVALLVIFWPVIPVKASVITVTNTNDGGNGSLRDALNQANVSASSTTITFNIPAAGVQRIAPTTLLPYVQKTMVIDATTQPGYVAGGAPLIELFGGTPGSTAAIGLVLLSSSNTVTGFTFDGFADSGIYIDSDSNTIQANYIGTDPTGSVAIRNGTGLKIAPLNSTTSTSNNLVGGTTAAARNVISGNLGNDVTISGVAGGTANNNVIAGNYIGVNAAGTAAVKDASGMSAPGGSGVEIAAGSYNTVGGATPGARNVIAGIPNGNAVLVNGQTGPTIGNVIQGNYIGTDATGSVGITNNLGVYIDTAKNTIVGGPTPADRNIIASSTQIGVTVDGSFDSRADGTSATGNIIQGNYIGTDVTGTVALGNRDGLHITAANDNTIGGTTPGAGNLISGNIVGIFIEVIRDTTLTIGVARGNMIQGNLIGTTASGTAPLGNVSGGIALEGGTANTIGGTIPGARNVIAAFGVTGIGISLDNPTSQPASMPTGNLIQGNYIGTDITGTRKIVTSGQTFGLYIANANNNVVGGTAPGAGNVIAYVDRGVSVISSTGDAILGNSMFANSVLGIVLANGGNNLEPAPTLTGVTVTGGNQITVAGSLGSNGTPPFRIEFFSTPTATAQGTVFLGATSTNGGVFRATVSAAVTGQYITATATDAQNNTSQFSNAQLVTVGPPAAVTANTGTTQSVIAGTATTLAVTVRDANNAPVGAGITVTFTAPISGPSGVFTNAGRTIQVQTNASGVASTTFTTNMIGGMYQITASVTGATPATFTLTNAPNPQPPVKPTVGGVTMPNPQPGLRTTNPVSGPPQPQPQPQRR